MEIPEECAKSMSPFRHDVNQLMKAHNETGSKVDLSLTMVADRLGRVEAHRATASGNIQTSNVKCGSQEVETIKASSLLQQVVEDEILSEEDWNGSKGEFDSEISSSAEEDISPRCRSKVDGAGPVK